MTTARLQAWVREHGFPCRVEGDGLRVASQAYCYAPDGGGRTRWIVEVIPARLSSVREWLGY